MQAFLPYPSYYFCSKVLDKKRLNKQPVEVRQILAGLGEKILKVRSTEYVKTQNPHHPILKTWHNFNESLKLYHDFMLLEAIRKGMKTDMEPFLIPKSKNILTLAKIQRKIKHPDWLGDKELHLSHQSMLLSKKYDHYIKYFGQNNWEKPPLF